MIVLRRWLFVMSMIAVVGCGLLAPPVRAQDGLPGALPASSAEPSQLDSGDTAWMLIATGLALFMTLPGLALFYGGLVRTKNVLSILMQCLVLTALLSCLWILCGYSLAFTGGQSGQGWGGSAYLGGLSKCMLSGVAPDAVRGTIPEMLFVAFEMTFAILAPVLVIGAFAERMKFSAVLLFSALWLFVVYVPICHMTWAGPRGLFASWGVKDFAGGLVVHVSAGYSALMACVLVGPRAGYPHQLEPPHNMTMTVTGAAMLWVGWFGFNAGNAFAANGQATMALLATHLSACVATLVWVAIEWFSLGKPSVLGAATGAIAGLAAVSPASGFIGPVGSMVIGACAGGACYLFATRIKRKFRYDDSLDVFGVHGIAGSIGTLLVAVFASSRFGGSLPDLDILAQLWAQATAVAMTAAYAMLATCLILKAIQFTCGLRVELSSEQRGLDISEHEERGYIL